MNREDTRRDAKKKRKKRRNGETKKKRKGMVPMGNTFMKHGTMVDLVSKAFAGGPGGQFSRKEPPWPPEA
jgi:hypothetical protein